MNSFDFTIVVIPLAFIVFGLVACIILLSKRQEIEEKRRVSAFQKGKAKQKELLESQMGNLDQLYQKESIDAETYERLKSIVRMSVEKSDETVDVLAQEACKK
jgi:predicted Holliday junction resolvase-like endonuclease